MKTKLIFDQEGVQVYETDNGDKRGLEYHITDGNIGCSLGFKPDLDTQWLKQYIVSYMNERKDSLDNEIKEM